VDQLTHMDDLITIFHITIRIINIRSNIVIVNKMTYIFNNVCFSSMDDTIDYLDYVYF
jgi:hypothetical protein